MLSDRRTPFLTATHTLRQGHWTSLLAISSVPYLLNEVSLFTYSLKQLKHLKVFKRSLTILLLSIPYQLKAFKSFPSLFLDVSGISGRKSTGVKSKGIC